MSNLPGRYLPGLLGLLLSAASFVSAPGQEAGFPLVTSFSAAQIGSDAASWTMVQDRMGVLHFGSNDLRSFDGDRWRSDAINGAYALRGLDLGPDGRIWAGAIGEIGWFDPVADGGWRFHSLRPNLPKEYESLGDVWYAWAEGNGAVFVTADKVLRWDGQKFHVWPMPGPRRLTAMRSGGVIYIDHLPTGLCALRPDGPQLVIPAAVLGNSAVLWLEPHADGWTLVTTRVVAVQKLVVI